MTFLRLNITDKNLGFMLMRWYDIMSLGNEPACDVDTTPIFLKPANEVAERLCFYRCLSIILLGGIHMWPLPMMHWTSLYRPTPLYGPQLCPHPVQDPGPSPPASDIWWSRLDICSNLCTWRPHCTSPQPVMASSGWLRTVGERAVRILLECFLVYILFRLSFF